MSLMRLLGYILASFMLLLRWTTRKTFDNDPRDALRAKGEAWIYAVIHAHTVSCFVACDHKPVGTLVSRSRDGELVIPMIRSVGNIPVRGSTKRRGKSKGGSAALSEMADLLRSNIPVIFTIDGPKGPRNHAHIGACLLAMRSEAPIVPLVLRPRQRLIISKAWDRMQVPLPFTCIEMYFGDPIRLGPDADLEAESKRLGQLLRELEREHDPVERQRCDAIEQARSSGDE
jgi:lysophospholipid acyltransferase (LPLAT)-like uncharacterized protein